MVTNSRLEALASPLLDQAKEQYERQQQLQQQQEEHHQEEQQRTKVRLVDECLYKAESWQRERRVVYKAEVMDEGTNTRFVVTTKSQEPTELYEWYVKRGESENRIKDLKLGLKADRLSCCRFMANQFRLLLHAAAYWLLDVLRSKLLRAGIERMQFDTLRQRFIKIGGRVRQLLRRVKVHLASGHPGQQLWQALSERAHE